MVVISLELEQSMISILTRELVMLSSVHNLSFMHPLLPFIPLQRFEAIFEYLVLAQVVYV